MHKSSTQIVDEIEHWGQFHQHFMQSFVGQIPKPQKTDNFTVFFALLGSVQVKAACRMLMKLTTELPDIYIAIHEFKDWIAEWTKM